MIVEKETVEPAVYRMFGAEHLAQFHFNKYGWKKEDYGIAKVTIELEV